MLQSDGAAVGGEGRGGGARLKSGIQTRVGAGGDVGEGEGRRGECTLEVLRELPELVLELLEVPSVGGRACTYLSPWEGIRVCVCV